MRLIYNKSRVFAVLFKYGLNLHGTVLFRIIIFNLKISNEKPYIIEIQSFDQPWFRCLGRREQACPSPATER